MENANYETLEGGTVVITIDMAGAPLNVMNDAFGDMLDTVLARLEAERDSITGVIITSGKASFVAGGDVNKILALTQGGAEAGFAFVQALKARLRRIESFGRPVVASINGSALGGGLELALACHHRIAIDDAKSQIGFPEVGLGILPAAGGVVRTVRMLGLMKALPLLTEGRRLAPQDALQQGLVDELASSREDMLAKAKAWIATNPSPRQPWEVKGYSIPGGNMFAPENIGAMSVFPSMIFKKTRGLLPAAERILAVASESTQVGFDAAMLIESRTFAELLMTPVTENLIRTMFLQMNEITAGESRPKGFEKQKVRKVGILGAGMMGRGIAYSCACAGIDVVLKDISLVSAEAGKAYSRDLLDKAVKRGRKTKEDREAILARIQPTILMEDLSDCDLVIEAVFEDVPLKKGIVREVEAVLKTGTIVATNTSTLPISLLAEASANPTNFVGLHFFSPVDKMHIVEIICGKGTSEETLARVYNFVQQIKKTPIVVHDSRGFFTSRVFSVFADEGDRLLKDGVDPAIIENAARDAGMPVGPLAVQDEVMMDMLLRSYKTNRVLDQELGDSYSETYAVCAELCELMCDCGRAGRGAGAGFYDYLPDDGKQLWPGLTEMFGGDKAMDYADVRDRMMYRMVVEAARCLQENVVTSERDGNIGSILAFGFPSYSGGVFQFIRSMGIDAFLARCETLASAYGQRFSPPEELAERLARSNTALIAINP
ncbi:3-hydroxyacyl-CoA dehydrogenase NAD-binding domain-containing protein [Sphingobium indicum]|uniref:3-hydroxyacyl-CoA dehydrogenase NAD-binding domain-containing protein n=1 Tax=Sphingobium indicum TaxID=332055 RepID=UPI001E2F6CFF|nr:3-hydroxyacyl-CoA dehydrogenase NAD-binding domain-containing protein [Sphingobium indicum]